MLRQRKFGQRPQAATVDRLVSLASGLPQADLDELITALRALRLALDQETAAPNQRSRCHADHPFLGY
jgi:hypothetical protein